MKKLNGMEGCSNPVGDARRLRPRVTYQLDEEDQLTLHGLRAYGSGIQQVLCLIIKNKMN